jgi:gliding motility-associated-like protein
MRQFLATVTLLFSFYYISNAQGVDCSSSNPFCTGTTYNYPAGVNVPDMGSVGCLLTTPNPAWYYLQIANPGNLDIHIASSAGVDVDFICWGPFSSLAAACATNLMSNSGVDCSYSTAATEDCNLTNTQTGEIYVLLITNYANVATNEIFSQTGGTGSTDCSIVAPPITGDTVCVGETINFTVNNPTVGATYSWTGPNGFSSNTMNPTISNATTAMSGVYSMVITVGGQTSQPVTCTVLVNPNPTITISPTNPSACAGSSVVLTATCSTGIGWFTWSNGSQGTGPITVTPTATTTYTVTGTDQNGCSGTASVTVTIASNLTITATATPPSVCPGQSTTLSAVGGTTYTWQPGAMPGSSVTVTPAANTVYSVSATDANGCTGSTTVAVTISSNLTITASATPPTICLGQNSVLTAAGGTTYTWEPGTLPGNPVTITPATTTVYSVSASDANGCTGTANVSVTVLTSIVVNATANPASICNGQSSNLTATGGLTYTWEPGTLSGSTVTVSPTVNTTYTVSGDMNGCTGSTTVTVDVSSIPNLTIAADIYEGCEDLLVHFSDLSSVTTGTWYWDFGDNGFSYLQNPTHLYTEAGTYDVSLSINSSSPCGASITWAGMITVFPRPYAFFTPNPSTVSELDPTVFFNDQSIGADGWNWYFGDTNNLNNNSNYQNPIHIYSDTGAYTITLVAITEHGCTDTISQNIYVDPNISYYVPNAFTPNDDSKNQNFTMFGEGINWSTFEMRIYDRWGKILFLTNDNESGWDGKTKGKKATPGFYAYQISFTDIKFKEHKLKGTVGLIK